MTLANILSKTTVRGYSATEEASIRAAITTAYNGSATARSMMDGWVATAGNTIDVANVAGVMRAYPNTGRLEVDLSLLANASYIDNRGNAVEDTRVTAIMHEMVHALTGRLDNWDRAMAGDYRGDTVKMSNDIYRELGLPEQNSYIAYDSTGTVLDRERAYTNGTAIDRSISGDQNLSTAPAGSSNDLLVGGTSANRLDGGAGNDFLFGNGGNDALEGGDGRDTGVAVGKPIDYDVRLNADGSSWTVRHVRGAVTEGTDNYTNIEQIQFEGGTTFNLTKGGLTYQTDFAFVVDTTGSMSDDIAAVQSAANSVIDSLFASGTIDARIGVVSFKDNTIGEPTQIVLPFTDQDTFADRQAAAKAAIMSLSASGGGDFPETAFDGLLKALDGSMGGWREGAGTKRIALFTDASAKDTSLLPTVSQLAADTGVSISASSSRSLGDYGKVDTFIFEPLDKKAARSLDTEGGGTIPYFPGSAPPTAVGGVSSVQITTIFIDSFIDPDSSLAEVSEGTGGSVLVAADPDEVVRNLLALIETANYAITVDSTTTTEGRVVTFTIARDRADNASTVTLAAIGTATAIDVSAFPTEITLAAGVNEQSIEITIIDDTEVEPDETFGLRIVEISENSSVGLSEALVTIGDDDSGVILVPGTPGDDVLEGSAAAEIFDAMDGDDVIAPRGGGDMITLGAGRDVVLAYATADIDGNTITDFGVNDRILFKDQALTRGDFSFSTTTAGVSVQVGSAEYILEGSFTGGEFMVSKSAADTVFGFHHYLPALKEGVAVEEVRINGITNPDFLTGDGTTDFGVTLRDMGYAKYNNVLGVYEITADGTIVDARILFMNANADKTATAAISHVEAGHKLGFFLVQDAATWASGLADTDVIRFINFEDDAASINDGSNISLAVNGKAVDHTVFHSFSPLLNDDGAEHALSGVDVGGESLSIGFEDLTGRGDRDYEDIVFKVEPVNDEFLWI